jgi:hypothetical protein
MTRRLLIVTGALEGATGAGLLIAPGLVVSLLLGAALNESGATLVARICGAALIVVGIACWSTRNEGQSPSARGLMSGLLFYNVVASALLVYGWSGLGLRGIGLWPAVLGHLALAIWTLACMMRTPRPHGTSH